MLPLSLPTVLLHGVPLAAVSALALAAMTDLGWRLIPNRAVAAVVACGLTLRLGAGGPGELAAAAALALASLLACALLWRRGLLGGGDVKLLAACVTLVPPAGALDLVLAVALTGGALSLAYLALHRLTRGRAGTGARPHGLARRLLRAEAWRIRRGGPLPYGVAIAGGAAFQLFAVAGAGT